MQVDVLIVGQGICGTMLSWYLHKEGKSFVVIDDGEENTSSKVAAGIINPVTGRRYVTTWMIEELMSFAKTTYSELNDYLDATLIYHKNIIDFFPSAQMRNAFAERVNQDDTYLRAYPDQNSFNDDFHYDFGCGEICPVYIVDVSTLLTKWKDKLIELNSLQEERFNNGELQTRDDGVLYKNITAKKVIFCDGIASMTNPWFEKLPFSANKGEALIIECDDLPTEHIYKKGLVLAPLPKKNLYWVGSNYQWEFEDDKPSQKFYIQSNELLKRWLKKPFKIVSHKAAIRPATLERRPFVGFHPLRPAIGILNGMGTKGASLAPFFAHQLVQNIAYNFPISDEANIYRFNRMLSK